MKPLIISLAVKGRENYPEKQKGLIKTLHVAGDCDWWVMDQYTKDITPHSETPYLFKFDLLNKAIGNGYTKVFWLDSSMRLLRNPFELLDKSKHGVVAFDNLGHPLYKYISDIAVNNLNVNSIFTLKKIPQTWGGALGFDFSKNKRATGILDEVMRQSRLGSLYDGVSVRDGFVAHRHDQAVLSVLFWKSDIDLLPYGVIAAKKDVTDKTYIQYGD